MSGNHVYIYITIAPCDLDLSPSQSKINRGYVLSMINQQVKIW